MFNLGLTEMLIVGVAALFLIGHKRLPGLARGLGRALRGFKGSVEDGMKNDDEKLPKGKGNE